ncbi:hypothetical protein AB0E96_10310 [Kitasatospora sp. NPDC036755]|uniref:hypothetical protein n=1 Tax=Kitasatospora sp. NPDC036755 TaxID=3154600 RepID=UPI0033FAA1E8
MRCGKSVLALAVSAVALVAIPVAPVFAGGGYDQTTDGGHVKWHAEGYGFYSSGPGAGGFHIWGTLTSDDDNSAHLNIGVAGYDPVTFHVDPHQSLYINQYVEEPGHDLPASAWTEVCAEHWDGDDCSEKRHFYN